MDIVERLRKVDPDKEGERTRWYRNPDGPEAADEIERLRQQNAESVNALQLSKEALKTFADNVKQTNEAIDKNWAETIYPLMAENQRLRQQVAELVDALKHYACSCPYADGCSLSECGSVARDAIAKATGKPTAECR